jgi:CHAT domain-containing protein
VLTKGYETPALLVAAIGQGDKRAELALFDRYYKQTLFLLERKTSDPDQAQDLCQEALLIVIERLRSQPLNADILHIATHGYFNDRMPELIGFALSGDSDEDGFVSMAEISNAQFHNKLVVLSACSSGQGEQIPGEGNMSLARAFLAQGVDSVVSTLWPVSDRATALFMKEFYRSLKNEGANYAGALRNAQLALRRSANYRNPYYWGAFTLISSAQQAQTD